MSETAEIENRNNINDQVFHSQLEKWWDIPQSVNNVAEYILEKVEQHVQAGKEICIENPESGDSLKYSQIPETSRKIANKFLSLGLNKGDTVICSTHDPLKIHVFMHGIWRADGVVRLVYPEELGDALVRRLKESKARFLACDAKNVAECRSAINAMTDWQVSLIIFPGDTSEAFPPEGKRVENEFHTEEFFSGNEANYLKKTTSSLDDLALILPTSGTTGDSKGAIYTHRILIDNLLAHEHMPFTDSPWQPTIITSRQTHYCGSVVALSFFTAGRYLLMMRSASVLKLLEAVDKYKVRAIVAFPTYLTGMVNHPEVGMFDLSSLQFLSAAGQVIVPEAMVVIRKLPKLKNFINLYGMTEAGLLATSADWSAVKQGIYKALDTEEPYSVGKLAPSSSLKVLDIDNGLPLGPNMKGELCFKTSVTTAGYLCSPQEQMETFCSDGWIKTGDIGFYNEDGFIFVVDRAKEIFKWNSNHVSPSEIENVLLRHPGVGQAVVVAVPGENDEGFVPRGFVVPKKEMKLDTKILRNELIQLTESYLPPYKHLKGGLFILDEIPLGRTGKVTRKLLAQISPHELLLSHRG